MIDKQITVGMGLCHYFAVFLDDVLLFSSLNHMIVKAIKPARDSLELALLN